MARGDRGPEWPWLNDIEPFESGVRPVVAEHGMVSSPNPLASQVGLSVLLSGGNAVDAAVATSAALMVLAPMQCSPGGDAFWLIRKPDEGVEALNGSGAAPRAADAERLRALGMRTMPERGPLTITVPGVISSWVAALERYGTRPIAELLEPAIRLAQEGFFVTRYLRAAIAVAEPVLRQSDEGIRWYLADGVPRTFGRLRQPELAACLRELARSEGRSMYTGEIATDVAAAVTKAGGWLAVDDLAAHTQLWQPALATRFGDLEILQAPPNSQGVVLLEALNVLEAYRALQSELEDAPEHAQIEALRSAFADGDRLVGDISTPTSGLLDLQYARERAELIDPNAVQREWRSRDGAASAVEAVRRSRDGDTAHLAIVDSDRMGVSLTQSLYDDFGSGVPVPRWGFMLHNRGRGFSLEPRSVNELRPSRRPRHTLTPGLAQRAGSLAFAFGCMGGDGQPQTQMQLLTHLRTGQDPQEAIAAPRWYIDIQTAGRSRVLVESRVKASVVRELRRRGHHVVRLGPYEEVMGHAQVISVEPSGALVGGADPRTDGHVAGW